jgi:hypothetical protein
MNRLPHLKDTLLKNIEDNISYKELEFILLDYNSSDGLEEWVRLKLTKYIDDGILKYYRTSEPKSFHRSHSRNVAMKLGSGDIVCNLDADNFLGKDFAFYVNFNFSFNKEVFMTSGLKNGSYGKVCARKEHFLKIRGYDERMSGWGYEDDDLYFRLNLLGLNQVNYFEKEFTKFIDHPLEDSFINDKNISNITDILINRISQNKTELIFLLSDGKFKYVSVSRQNDLIFEDPKLEKPLEQGKYQLLNNLLDLQFKSETRKNLVLTKHQNSFISDDLKFHSLTDKVLINRLKILLTSLENKALFTNKKNEKEIISNKSIWGETVLETFML